MMSDAIAVGDRVKVKEPQVSIDKFFMDRLGIKPGEIYIVVYVGPPRSLPGPKTISAEGTAEGTGDLYATKEGDNQGKRKCICPDFVEKIE